MWEVGDKVSEGQAAGVYGTGFTQGSLARVGARDGKWENLLIFSVRVFPFIPIFVLSVFWYSLFPNEG